MAKSRLFLVLAGVLALGASVAKADLVFSLGTGNSGLTPPYSGPFVSVDVHLVDSTHATITFTSLTNSGNIYLMGDGGTVGINVDASSFTLGTVTGTNAGTGFSPGPFTQSSGNEDGFGSFNLSINSF